MAVAQAVRRPKIFYGWYIVALAFLAMMSASLQFYAISVFMKPLIAEFGWSRGAVSAGQSVSVVVSGLVAPFLGGILDRHGGKPLMLFGTLVFGAGLMAFSLMQELWHFYLIISLLIATGHLCMGGFVVNTAVSNWFVRKRGRAVGITAMGVSFAGVALAPLAQLFIDSLGWRTAFVILGAMIWAIMLLPTALIMRRRPEDVGLRPDGDPPSGVEATSMNTVQRAAAKADVKWTRAEAMRRPTLWMLIAAFGLSLMGYLGVGLHLVPYVSDMGFSPAVAASVISVQSGVAMCTKLAWGFLLERFQVRYLAAFSFTCATIGLILLMVANSIETVYLSQIVFGIGLGGNIPNQEVVWANYFGRLTLGTIRSVGMPFMIVSSAGGPVMAGVVFDLTGSYRVAFATLAVALVVALVLMLLVRPPKPPTMSLQGQV